MKKKKYNLGDGAKAVPWGNSIAPNAYIRKEGCQISGLTFHLKKF